LLSATLGAFCHDQRLKRSDVSRKVVSVRSHIV
jgi:hypothetical protein